MNNIPILSPAVLEKSICAVLVFQYLWLYIDNMENKKRELEQWEKEECAALKSALHQYNLQAPKQSRMTQEKIASDLDISQGAVSGYLNGRLALNLNIATYFANKLNITIRSFSERLAKDAEKIAKMEGRNVEPFHQGSTREVPLISYVQAGTWEEASDPYSVGDAEDWIAAPAGTGPHAFWLRVVGDSMTSSSGPSIPEGYVILVEPDLCANNGELVVAKLIDTNEVTFKKLVIDAGKSYLKPLNPSYRTIEINGNCKIVGVVREARVRF